MNLANTCHEQPQEIINLRDRTHGAAAIGATSQLLDRECRLKAVDAIDIRTRQLREELS